MDKYGQITYMHINMYVCTYIYIYIYCVYYVYLYYIYIYMWNHIYVLLFRWQRTNDKTISRMAVSQTWKHRYLPDVATVCSSWA